MAAKLGWHADERGDVAAYILSSGTVVEEIIRRPGYLVISLEKFTIFLCYCSPNIPAEEAKIYLGNVFSEARRRRGDKLILGDLIAKSGQWGSPVTDARGLEVMEWVEAMDLVVLNRGGVPTFQRGDSASFIDITLANKRLARRIRGWEVKLQETLSDHRHIVFGVTDRGCRQREGEKPVTNWGTFKEALPREMARMSGATWTEETLMECVARAHKVSTSTIAGRKRTAPYWWNTEIEVLRGECTARRRAYARAGIGQALRREELEDAYRRAKADLRKAIRMSKRAQWKALLDRLDDDIWGDGYKIVTKALAGYPPQRFWRLGRGCEKAFPSTHHGNRVASALRSSRGDPLYQRGTRASGESPKSQDGAR